MATKQTDGTFSNRLTIDAEALVLDKRAGNQGRSNTRLVVYDVSNADVPAAAAKQYVIQLPRIDDNGATGGLAVNRNGAQSEVIALNDHQLLILSRDGNGRGASGAPVFKSILLADLSKATNIDGGFDAANGAVAPSGVLNANVKAIEWIEALNMIGKLGPDAVEIELARFGLNIATAPGDINSLSEKWEGLGLVSAMDRNAPNDYFMFIGNDNDFQSASGKYLDANGVLQSYNAGLENDTVLLAYRVRIAEIPEPATNAAVMAGLLAMFALRRRHRG